MPSHSRTKGLDRHTREVQQKHITQKAMKFTVRNTWCCFSASASVASTPRLGVNAW